MRTFWMLLSGATDGLAVSGAAVAAVAKSALAPTAREIAILIMMSSRRGVSRGQTAFPPLCSIPIGNSTARVVRKTTSPLKNARLETKMADQAQDQPS